MGIDIAKVVKVVHARQEIARLVGSLTQAERDALAVAEAIGIAVEKLAGLPPDVQPRQVAEAKKPQQIGKKKEGHGRFRCPRCERRFTSRRGRGNHLAISHGMHGPGHEEYLAKKAKKVGAPEPEPEPVQPATGGVVLPGWQPPEGSLTIRQLAERAGVSTTTVANYARLSDALAVRRPGSKLKDASAPLYYVPSEAAKIVESMSRAGLCAADGTKL